MSIKQIIMDEGGSLLKVNPDGTISIQISASDIMQQTDVQRRYQKMVTAISAAVVVASTGTQDSVFIDTSGFNELGLTFMSDTETGTSTNRMDLIWSHDNVNTHAMEKIIMPDALDRYRVANTTIKARYVKVRVYNKDTTGPHTMSAWLYMKV